VVGADVVVGSVAVGAVVVAVAVESVEGIVDVCVVVVVGTGFDDAC